MGRRAALLLTGRVITDSECFITRCWRSNLPLHLETNPPPFNIQLIFQYHSVPTQSLDPHQSTSTTTSLDFTSIYKGRTPPCRHTR